MVVSISSLISAVTIVALSIAVVTDIKSRKVYNWLTFPVLVLGFILNGIQSGPHGLLFSLEGLGVSCLAIPLFVLSGMGAGDVKLLLALGALTGPHFTLRALIGTALIGGVMGLLYALYRGELSYTIKNALIGAHVFLTTKSTDSLKGMAATSKVGKIAYAPAIALGSGIACFLIHFKIV